MLTRWEGEGTPGRGDGFPQMTFRDELTLSIGGTEIQLYNLGRAHTDTDVVVWIPAEKVVHVGDLFFNRMTPYVDVNNGAHTGKWISVINEIIERVGPEAIVIPGHGELSDVKGFNMMALYLEAVRQAVVAGHEEGKSKDEILSLTLDDLGEEFAGWSGSRLGMALSAAYAEIVGGGNRQPVDLTGYLYLRADHR
jgi:glyoxylase-like metal-dependent hydrolase (beta-lactamase superfamily II)